MSSTTSLLEDLTIPYSLTEIPHRKQVSDLPMVYLVAQGKNILAIGQSATGQRLRALMGEASLHNKKPLLSLCAKIWPELPLRFFYRTFEHTHAAEACEHNMQAALGRATGSPGNEDTFVEGDLGYGTVLARLLARSASSHGFSERHLDLFEMIRLNGDIFQTALRSSRLRPLALELFGHLYSLAGVRQLIRPPVRRGIAPTRWLRVNRVSRGTKAPTTKRKQS